MLFAAVPSVGRYLPGKAGDALAGQPVEHLLTPGLGAAVLVAWTLVSSPWRPREPSAAISDPEPYAPEGSSSLHQVASREAGSRFQFTLQVDNVDAMCAELTAHGVELLNGPMDRPWGIRTASFIDPGGHIWEIAH